MEIDTEVFRNLASVYFTYYSKEGLLSSNPSICKEAQAILKVLGIDYSLKTKELSYTKDGLKYTFGPKDSNSENKVSRVTPVKLGTLDTQSVEEILNLQKYIDHSVKMAPLLDAIGYILVRPGGEIRMEFIGSPLWDSWKYVYKSEEEDFNGMWKKNLDGYTDQNGNPINLEDIKWIDV